MVHRPADSRLLTNLLNHEKDYSKHLSILLDYSQTSLASFSAYAAASAPPTSQVIIAVAGVLAGADDALRNYASAVERWQEQLRTLKNMEDGLGNIMRDREILVTRLIKATKQQKSSRDSIGGSPSGSALSITKPEVQVGPKMGNAQAELQACEAQLAAKEQELNTFRTHTVRSGLQARCKAMVECGWAWGEMGKEGIRALVTLDMPNGHGSPSMHPYVHQKPFSGYEKASSDVSSLAPSQSASQIGHASASGSLFDPAWRTSSALTVPTPPKPYTLEIPPAHSINEFVLPNGVATPATIIEETGGSSVEEEDGSQSQLEVHENPRFSKGRPKVKAKPVPPVPPLRHVSFSVHGSKGSPADINPTSYSLRNESPTKKRGVFGSLAALFHVGNSRSDGEFSSDGSPSKANGRWQTRIDKNLAATRRGDSSDEESSPSYVRRTDSPRPTLMYGNALDGGETARLKKRTSKRSSVQAQSPSRMATLADKGYVSDTVTGSINKARANGRHQRTASQHSTDVVGGSARLPDRIAGPSGSGRLKKNPTVTAVIAADGGSSLSRNSSLSKQSVTSVASAPPRTSVSQFALHQGNSFPRKRSASLNPTPPEAGPSTPTGHKNKRSLSMSTSTTSTPTRLTLTNGEPSLMTIVEGMSRLNKEAALKQDPNRLLVTPKAPGPISVRDSIGELPVITLGRGGGGGTPVRREPKNSQQVVESYRDSLHMSGSVSTPSLPLFVDRSKPLPSPVKMPLRSALRNASRTPSPQPVHSPLAILATTPGSVTALVIAQTLTSEPRPMKRRESDSSSISSYETGHEAFDDEPAPPASSTDQTQSSAFATPRQPTPSSIPQSNGDAQRQDGSELSHSTNSTILTSTAADQPPKRRKSVRMSLPPTFSATPPAIEDTEEDEAARHAPWASPGGGSVAPQGWGTRIEQNGTRDVWEDSSDEDVEYSAAKRMLARVSRKHGREREG